MESNDDLTVEERHAVMEFTRCHLQLRNAIGVSKDTTRPLKERASAIRAALLKSLQESSVSAWTFVDDSITWCLRHEEMSSTRKLSKQHIQDAIDNVTRGELVNLDREGAVDILSRRVQTQRIVTGDTVRICKTTPGSAQVVDRAPPNVVDLVNELQSIQSRLAESTTALKEEKDALRQGIDSSSPVIFTMMTRLQKKSHRVDVKVDGKSATYFIRRKLKRVSSSSSKAKGRGGAGGSGSALHASDITKAVDAILPESFTAKEFIDMRHVISEELVTTLTGEDETAEGDEPAEETEPEQEERLTLDMSTRGTS
tara:strand:- start:527 stop:1465 length:939 start_codon:yes stop_codon:yes gene_type:complete